MLKFREEFKDIVDVTKISVYSFGSNEEMTPKRLIMAGGGSKFSTLCGFKFYSKVNPEYKNGEFKIVYCAKLRSKIYRQANQNPSQWFAFLQTGKDHVEVLDKKFAMLAFDFDVDKFFQTDLFAAMTKRFEAAIKNGLKNAEEMVSKMKSDNSDAAEYEFLPRYIKAIREALPGLSSTKFNDAKYTLTMKFEDPRKKYDHQKKFDIDKFARFVKQDQDRAKLKKILKTDPDADTKYKDDDDEKEERDKDYDAAHSRYSEYDD